MKNKKNGLSFIAFLGPHAAVSCVWLLSLVTVVEAPEPITNKMLFVIDRSGSMRDYKLEDGITAITSMLKEPTDDARFGLIAFNGEAIRWEGIQEEECPKGWALLPSVEAVEKATKWMGDLTVKGTTVLLPAMALALGDPTEDLSVILISDGLYNQEITEALIGSIALLQAKRKNPARIFVIGVKARQDDPVLNWLAKTYRGGYYLIGEIPPANKQLGPTGWERF